MNKLVEITKEQFERYVKVQMSGVTNMFDIEIVQQLSGLTRSEILDIYQHYSEYQDKFAKKVE